MNQDWTLAVVVRWLIVAVLASIALACAGANGDPAPTA